MKFLADENMSRAIVTRLRDLGHDVLYAADDKPGAADSGWLDRAEADGRIVLTANKDFGDLIYRDRLISHGVILLRLGDMLLTDRVARLEQAWAIVELHPTGKFIAIAPSKIRIRDLFAEDVE